MCVYTVTTPGGVNTHYMLVYVHRIIVCNNSIRTVLTGKVPLPAYEYRCIQHLRQMHFSHNCYIVRVHCEVSETFYIYCMYIAVHVQYYAKRKTLQMIATLPESTCVLYGIPLFYQCYFLMYVNCT